MFAATWRAALRSCSSISIKDAQNRTVTRELYQPFCISDGSEPRLNPDPATRKQLDNGWRVALGQVH